MFTDFPLLRASGFTDVADELERLQAKQEEARNDEGYSGIAHDFLQLQNERNEFLSALRQIDAALNQNATFPADVELARKAARSAIAKAEGK
jgi:hypothetical protein